MRFLSSRALATGIAAAAALLTCALPAAPATGSTPTARPAVPTCSLAGKPLDAALTNCPNTAGAMVVGAHGDPAPAAGSFLARDLQRFAHLPADGVGAKQGTVAILAAGAYPNLESDLNVYRTTSGLAPCTSASGCLKVVGLDGGAPPAPNTTAALLSNEEEAVAIETASDVDMASAACPNCKILVVEFPFDPARLALAAYGGFPVLTMQSFATAAQTAHRLGADAISMSYGYKPGNQAGQVDSGAIAESFHFTDTAMVVPSGDFGYNGTNTTVPQQYPWVTVAGLITANKNADGSYTLTGRGYTQPDGSFQGGGSGCAVENGPAIGQPSSVSSACNGHRAYSDISMIGANAPIYDSWFPSGKVTPGWFNGIYGSSLTAPFVAGLYARAGATGVEGPNTLYNTSPSNFTDVTEGSNSPTGAAGCAPFAASVCVAGPGWDGPSGLGIPNGLGAF